MLHYQPAPNIPTQVLDLPQDLQLSGLDNLNNIGLHILNQVPCTI